MKNLILKHLNNSFSKTKISKKIVICLLILLFISIPLFTVKGIVSIGTEERNIEKLLGVGFK